MNLKDVEAFCAIVEAGNLTRAARKLHVNVMVVSRRLAQLEAELGIRLFQRTTRAVSLTREGEEFLPYARTLVDAEQTAKNIFSSTAQGAHGLLKVTAPSGFGKRTILPLLPALMRQNPMMTVELDLSDDVADIVGQGYDVAIRIAPLKDSRLVARRLADNPRVLCASPAYLAQAGCPGTLADLKAHSCLKITTLQGWAFERDGAVFTYPLASRFSCSSVEGVREMCIAGAGIAQLTVLDIREELAAGTLVALPLADADAQALSVWAVLPTRNFTPYRTTVFLDALQAQPGLA